MVRAFVWQNKLSGKYEEDLDGLIETLDTFAEMCDLSNTQRRKAIPIMLTVNALSLFNKIAKTCEIFDDAVTLCRTSPGPGIRCE